MNVGTIFHTVSNTGGQERRAIVEVLENTKETVQRVDRARKFIEENHTIDAMGRRIEALVDQTLSKKVS